MNQQEQIEHLTAALARIAKLEDAPDIYVSGEYQQGLHCGVEDIACVDQYEGANYGYACGMERGLEWAVNEAKAALEELE